MSQDRIFQLSDIISFDTMQEILSHLSNVTGLTTLLSDNKGIALFDDEVNFNPLCRRLRNSPAGHLCEKSDAYAGLEAARSGKPFIYRCHMGAVEAAVPIIVCGNYLGIILTGQARLDKQDMDKLEQIVKPDTNLKYLQPDLQELYDRHYQSLTLVSLKKFLSYAHLLFVIANYIAEIGYRNIIQKQLSEYEVNLLQEKNNNSELEKGLALLKLKNMQAQMNPHFLFNTLNTINQQAILEGAVETPKIIHALSAILRKTLKTSNQILTIEEELNYIKNYLYIKEFVIRGRVQIELHVDESCLDGQLPIFTIQPLVDNALTHGLEPKEEGGNLSISFVRENDTVTIQIEDTGLGMPHEVLKEILLLKSSEHTKTVSIGINNVIRILNDYFGASFSWDLKSIHGEGTKFTLRIPYQKR
ncbi:Sensor histidine kinase YehU [Pelotomaculum schinkii]|uniref:histidine kinase n=1 Tax=Pelotomaculum schinkii TaxID=78350 RepID=A0A4Y7R8X9_9FIRM|nr:PocR ligand-binding domain-containing protein [Pelotomaculum schinkii]TEB05415.1 Sensor histidine kinase YehU [Pelotomaculum schinkii]